MGIRDNDGQKTGRFIHGIAALLISMHPGPGATGVEASDKPAGWVARAVFTSAIEQREPVDQLAVVPNSMREVYFFTDLRQLQGKQVTHRWEYDGEVMAEVKFKVGGPRWRVFSRKSLDPDKTGKWTVVVVDETGWPLRASIFDYRVEPAMDGEGGHVELPKPVNELQQTAPPERGPAPLSIQ
jgi:hypothetical protein